MGNLGSFGVFSLLPGADGSHKGPGVDDQGRAIRQRRYHAKSSKGCSNCKSRRVKCDEHQPTCHKCLARKDKCDLGRAIQKHRHTPHQVTDTIPVKASENEMPRCDGSPGQLVTGYAARRHASPEISRLRTPTIDLKSLQLTHHFQHFTSDTLILGQILWRDQVLPLALQHEYLMHAILTISASHLHHLQPRCSEHARSVAVHLDRALSGFRAVLSCTTLSQEQLDVFIACGFILLHYAWSVPFFNSSSTGENSPSVGSDGLLWFAAGLKNAILAQYTEQPAESRSGIFHAYVVPKYVRHLCAIQAWTETRNYSYDFEGNFLGNLKESSGVLDEASLQRSDGSCKDFVERLKPVFHVVDAATLKQDISDMIPAIQMYLLTWPVKATCRFQDEIKNGNTGALAIMLSFYASSWLVLSDRVWWAHARCRVMCMAILSHLSQRESSQWTQNVSHIIDYFGFKRSRGGAWEVEGPSLRVG